MMFVSEIHFESSQKHITITEYMLDALFCVKYKIDCYAKGFIKSQMAQFGNMNPEEKELEDIAGRILSNQEEAKRLQDQLMSQKLITFFKENMKFDTKEVSYEDFIKEVYKVDEK